MKLENNFHCSHLKPSHTSIVFLTQDSLQEVIVYFEIETLILP